MGSFCASWMNPLYLQCDQYFAKKMGKGRHFISDFVSHSISDFISDSGFYNLPIQSESRLRSPLYPSPSPVIQHTLHTESNSHQPPSLIYPGLSLPTYYLVPTFSLLYASVPSNLILGYFHFSPFHIPSTFFHYKCYSPPFNLQCCKSDFHFYRLAVPYRTRESTCTHTM